MAKDVDFYFRSHDKATKDIDKIDKSLGGMSKSSKTANDSFTNLWKKLAAGAAATLAVKAVWGATNDFNDALGNLETLGPGVTAEIENIESGFLDIAGPIGSVKELTTEAYSALSGGVEPTKVVQFMADTAEFAKGNMIELGKAVDVTTTIQNTYGTAAGNTAQIQDQLTIAIREGKVRGEELAASFGGIAGTANTVGISFQDLNAFFISSTAGGIKFSESVSAMKGVISNIATPTKQAKAAAEGMAGGFSLASLQSQGLSGFLKSMTEHVAGNVQKQKDLFGSVEAFNAIAVVTSEQGAKKFDDALVSLSNSSGAAKAAFEKQELTLEGLRNTVEATFIKAFLPALRGMLSWINDNKQGIVDFFDGIVTVIGRISDVAGFAIKSIAAIVNTVMEMSPLISGIVEGWKNLLLAFSSQLSDIEDRQIGQIMGHANQLKAVSEKYRSFAREIGLTSQEMRQMSKDARDVETGLVDHNKIMLNIVKGKYGKKLSDDYKKWNEQAFDARNRTDEIKKAVSEFVPIQANLKDAVKGTVEQTADYMGILPPTINLTRNYGIDLLPKVNANLSAQETKVNAVSAAHVRFATDAEMTMIAMEKLNAEIKAIYDGLGLMDTVMDALDFGELGKSISTFFKGGANFAAGFAMFSTDPLGGLTNMIAGIKELSSIIGGTNWEARGNAFNAAIGGMIPPELMNDFIALGEEMGDFSLAYREMLDEIIEASDIADGGDLWAWVRELAGQIKGIAAGGGDIDRLGDAFAALANKGAENIGYLGRDFQMLILAIKGTGQEMEALDAFLNEMDAAGLDGYIAAMEAGFTNVIIPTYQEAQTFKELVSDHQLLVDGVKGWEQAMVKFGNTAKEIYQTDLASWMQGTVDAYNTLISQDFSKAESIEMLLPQLRTLNQMASDYNLELDAGTLALIEQAREAGYTVEAQQSGSAIMKEGFDGLTIAIKDLTNALMGDMTQAIDAVGRKTISFIDMGVGRFNDLSGAVWNVNNQISGVGETYEDLLDFINGSSFNVPNASGGNVNIPGFASGTPPGGFVVPPGYNSDNYLVGLTSGERIRVDTPGSQTTPQSQAPQSIVMNFYPTIYGSPGGDTVETLMQKFWEGLKYDAGGIGGKLRGAINA